MWRFIRRVVWPALESNWGRAIISLALLALTTLCSILIVDLLYPLFDPRIRFR